MRQERARRARDVRRPDAAILEWALASGRPVSADALAAVAGAKAAIVGAPADQWTAATVWELLWVGIRRWCHDNGVPVPGGIPQTLLAVIDHLDATSGLGSGSACHHELRRAVLACAGLTEAGTQRLAVAS